MGSYNLDSLPPFDGARRQAVASGPSVSARDQSRGAPFAVSLIRVVGKQPASLRPPGLSRHSWIAESFQTPAAGRTKVQSSVVSVGLWGSPDTTAFDVRSRITSMLSYRIAIVA